MTHTRAPERQQSGFTIVELMVVLVIFSVASLIMLSFLDSTTSATTRAGANVEAEREAQIVLRTMTQDIRGAASISAAYPGTPVCPASPTFTSPYGGYRNCISIRIARPVAGDETCPYTDVVYGLTGSVLRTTRTEYRPVGGVCAVFSTTSAKVVMSDVVNTAAAPLFTYYDRLGNDLVGASPAKAPTSAASVKISLVKRYRQLSTPDLRLSSVVALRNNR